MEQSVKPLFTGKNLTVEYGKQRALFLESFSLHQGEVVAITGPNGSGKSTLLRVLAFLDQLSAGEIIYYGNIENPRSEITLLLQEPYLLKTNIFKNVTKGLFFRNQKQNLDQKFNQALLEAGFSKPEEFARRLPGQLSGGEKQRIALASRLILNPRVLLLDEPTSNVDLKSGKVIIKALASASARGTGIVVATHDRDIIDVLQAREIKLAPAE